MMKKALPVSTTETEGVNQFSTFKALPNHSGTRRGQNLGQRGGSDVPKGDIPFGIKAAGDDSAVDKDTDMITQGAAGAVFPKIRGRGVRPTERLLLAEKDLRRQLDPLPRRQRGREGESKEAFQLLPDLAVPITACVFRQVPEPQTEKKW